MAVAANKRSIMMLYADETSLQSHQVRIVLAEKGISVEIKYVDPNNKPEELWELNPYGSIPTLLDRELVLYQADIIMEYLDERFPHPPLMPVYPVARGSSRLMMHRIKTDWYKLVTQIESGTAEECTAARAELREGILAIAPIFAETPFFMSEEFSLVDCVLAPLLWRLPKLGIELIGQGSKEVKEYMNRVFERESFQASLTDEEREMRIR
ncbi:stringent starvation protein SspA [Catenovulum maritimum]|jgi:RNA polymerase-associated protein|uniref:Stringent starvation protein A n=1 Tax=Catenovulum maritimum TaxID=1513271 RepID=A0A0J8GQQ0_9ALTE|nr:stringent starvation protein SspA [Catenovulum maritimum]KMT65042.1 stringent starvation protein A [Catenovulum maritimum]